MLTLLPGLVFFFCACIGLLAQTSERIPPDSKIYILGDSDARFCAFSTADKWQAEMKIRETSETGTLAYVKGKLATITLQSADESGDWSATETYQLDDQQRLVSLSRVISVRDGDEKESWLIKDGKALKRPIKRGPDAPDFVPELPVITELKNFPFWSFVRERVGVAKAKGMVCTADGGPRHSQ